MEEGEYYAPPKKVGKHNNTLPLWGNEASMNLNPLILTNIQGSSYFKVHLFKLKTYHEVVDEIYYQVKHLEPWERGSRKTAGQTGMCGGVRGVGAGGIVSTAYCLLYKLYTLKLTRKQVNGLLNHTDSPYIRALGFMYLRYTQPPGDLYDWYEDYLQDEEEIDVKAGGGHSITIGNMVYQFLTKLEWFSTLFPRIPVPIQKQIEQKLNQYCRENNVTHQQLTANLNAVGAAASYEEERYDRRGAAGGSGNYSSSSSRPPPSNYRTEHDDRDRDAYRANREESYRSQRADDYERAAPRREERYAARARSRSPSPSFSRDRHEHRDKEKHKKHHKKHKKHRNRSHSRSRSRSGSRSRSERKRDRHYK